MAKILMLLLLGISTLPAYGLDKQSAHKQQLERLKKQTAQKQEELKKYKEQERAISKEISALENKKAEAIRQKNKLQSDINYVEQAILSTEQKKSALERSMPMWNQILTQEMLQFYFTPHCAVCVGDMSVEEELFLQRALVHKAEFAVSLKEENKAAKQKITDFEQRNKKLMQASTQIEQKQQIISTNFLKKQQDLTLTKKKAQAIRNEINELNKSARELDDLIAKFERQRNKKTQKGTSGAAGKQTSIAKIDLPMHSLPWPVRGKVLSKFGKEYRADLNTWIFRDGIKIAARAAEPVKCVEGGEVIYAGPFRSYGNVVIVEHGKGFFSIYGFLQTIEASVGSKVIRGGVLGHAGQDTQQSSGTGQYAVYFETRQGTTAVDPMDWLE